MQRNEATDFLQLMKLEWGTKVTKLARITIGRRHFNKKTPLPKPEDVQKLSEYLIHELKALDLQKVDKETFRRAVIISQSRLIVYNKRRTGELEATR